MCRKLIMRLIISQWGCSILGVQGTTRVFLMTCVRACKCNCVPFIVIKSGFYDGYISLSL